MSDEFYNMDESLLSHDESEARFHNDKPIRGLGGDYVLDEVAFEPVEEARQAFTAAVENHLLMVDDEEGDIVEEVPVELVREDRAEALEEDSKESIQMVAPSGRVSQTKVKLGLIFKEKSQMSQKYLPQRTKY